LKLEELEASVWVLWFWFLFWGRSLGKLIMYLVVHD